MNTDQQMTIKIGNFGTLQIGHLSKMGKVSQVVEMGNETRKEQGLEEISIDSILKKQAIWEFIIARNTQISAFSKYSDSEELNKRVKSDYSILKEFKTEKGEIQYSKLMKQFPNLIKSKRGRNGGTWAELYILLKIASMLDKDLEVEIYRVFIEDKILLWRDLGGGFFKELNKLIDTLPDCQNDNNTKLYIDISLQIRRKLSILSTRGYNKKEHDSLVQENRAEWLKTLSFAISVGWIKSFDELTSSLEKLEVIGK
ncbi:hypothetical protein ThvES_00001210 [Thiovulum sp. ES]|nr:hypothetical protein ThvES_00001210 [Thiovulum sp. ES]